MRKIIVLIFLVLTFICSCGKSETALDWFNKAVALNYTDPQKAIEYLNHAIKLQPNYASAYNIRGISYVKLGQYQKAIEDFNETIRLDPNDAKTYINRAVAYTLLLQYKPAIEDYNKAISLNPDDVSNYDSRGYVYFKQGNKNLGCGDAKKACGLGNCKLLELAKNKKYCH